MTRRKKVVLLYRFPLKTVVSLEPLMDMELEPAESASIEPFYTLDKIFISTSYVSRSSELSRAAAGGNVRSGERFPPFSDPHHRINTIRTLKADLSNHF